MSTPAGTAKRFERVDRIYYPRIPDEHGRGRRRRSRLPAAVEAHRGELHAHCYRMLGLSRTPRTRSRTRWCARGAAGPLRGPRLAAPWLYRIATNRCLDVIAEPPEARPADRQREPGRGRLAGAVPRAARRRRPGLARGRYGLRESIELAFIAALQHLPANQRAVLILREVLGFSAAEVAASSTRPPLGQQRDATRPRSVHERLPDDPAGRCAARRRRDPRVVQRYTTPGTRRRRDDRRRCSPTTPRSRCRRTSGTAAASDPRIPARRPAAVARRFLPPANGQLAFGTYKLIDGEWVANAIHVVTLDGLGRDRRRGGVPRFRLCSSASACR